MSLLWNCSRTCIQASRVQRKKPSWERGGSGWPFGAEKEKSVTERLRRPECVKPNSSKGMVDRASDRIWVDRISAKAVANKRAKASVGKQIRRRKAAMGVEFWSSREKKTHRRPSKTLKWLSQRYTAGSSSKFGSLVYAYTEKYLFNKFYFCY